MDNVNIVIAGNPNCGKSTVFNSLTGIRQHTGNYPGVTVERREGNFTCNDIHFNLIDLPGIYNLTPDSPEELVARDELQRDNVDIVVNVLDASSLERNLYLTMQLLEMDHPLIIVLNMTDTAEKRGISVNHEQLSRLLKVPVIPAVGHKGIGLEELRQTLSETKIKESSFFNWIKHCDPHFSEKVADLAAMFAEIKITPKTSKRWLAVKLLEKDFSVLDNLELTEDEKSSIKNSADKHISDLESIEGEKSPVIVASQRYGFINSLLLQVVKRVEKNESFLTDKIDYFVTHRFFGIPLFLALMYIVFKMTFTLGAPFMELIENFFSYLSSLISSFWPDDSDSFLKSLLVDGIISGVGGVLVFLPNIILLFFGIALLEGTGYMARIAFIMDRFMNKIGLHGKSFIPMIIGFGCTVPAIMATRTLESEKDRLTTILVAPLMSCGARLPIYALIIPAFFPENRQAEMMMLIYLIGVVLAVVSARVLRNTLFKGEASTLIMELPPYRVPTMKSIFLHMWEKAFMYLKKAGTIILFISVILWAAATFPVKKEFSRDYSALTEAISADLAMSAEDKNDAVTALENARNTEIMTFTLTGRAGKMVEPLLKPLGFDWRIATALIGAFAAKEVFVSQMGIVYSVGDADEESDSLRQVLKDNYNPLQALCMMLFCLISVPCVATFAVTKKETLSWKWPFFQLIFLTSLAYIVTFVVYQSGIALGWGV